MHVVFTCVVGCPRCQTGLQIGYSVWLRLCYTTILLGGITSGVWLPYSTWQYCMWLHFCLCAGFFFVIQPHKKQCMYTPHPVDRQDHTVRTCREATVTVTMGPVASPTSGQVTVMTSPVTKKPVWQVQNRWKFSKIFSGGRQNWQWSQSLQCSSRCWRQLGPVTGNVETVH
jgi:hypothetical protein